MFQRLNLLSENYWGCKFDQGHIFTCKLRNAYQVTRKSCIIQCRTPISHAPFISAILSELNSVMEMNEPLIQGRATANDYFYYWLICWWFLRLMSEKCLNCSSQFPRAQCDIFKLLLLSKQQPEHKDSSFIFINDTENGKSSHLRHKPAVRFTFLFEKWLARYIDYQNSWWLIFYRSINRLLD